MLAYFSITTLLSFLRLAVNALNVNLPSHDDLKNSLEALTRTEDCFPSPLPSTYLPIFFLNLERRRPEASSKPGLIHGRSR